MSKLNDIMKEASILSKQFNLFKPNMGRSVAGVMPEIIRNMRPDFPFESQHVQNYDIRKRLEENFPSGIDKTIVIIADGVGAQHIQHYGGLLAENMNSFGTVASTMFPSMTSTVMSSISHGTYPAYHGVMGYNYYNENIGDTWNALAMKYRKNNKDRYVLDDFPVSDLIKGTNLLKQVNGQPFIAPKQLTEPSLLKLIMPEFPDLRYETLEEAIMMTVKSHMSGDFTGVYFPLTDKYGHEFGPESKQYVEALRGLEIMISKLLEIPTINDGSTAIVVTSDHGQSQINHDISKWMTKEEWDKHRDNGLLLTSSGRTNHIYCSEGKKDDGRQLLETLVDGRGIVIDNDEAMRLAGSEYHGDQFTQRMGDYVMITEDTYMYDVPERPQFEEPMKLKGQHGSLTAKELFVPVGIFGGSD